MRPNKNLCPQIVKEGIDSCVADAKPPGGFLQAVLLNDLSESFHRADQTNMDAMVHIVAYLYCDVPSACWGNVKNIGEWAAVGGANGLAKPPIVVEP